MIEFLQKLFHGLEQMFSSMELAIVGAIGAFLSLRTHPEVQGRNQVLLFIATGAAIAYFGTDLVADWFSIAPKRAGAVGFFLGIFGASLIEAVARAIKAADLWELISNRFGGGK